MAAARRTLGDAGDDPTVVTPPAATNLAKLRARRLQLLDLKDTNDRLLRDSRERCRLTDRLLAETQTAIDLITTTKGDT